MKTVRKVYYCCPFVPAEWIAAHGFEAARLFPRSGAGNGDAASAGLCTYTAAVFDEAEAIGNREGLILTTLCDQMRRAADILKTGERSSLFLMNVPSTYGFEGVRKLYREELERLGRFLEGLGGKKANNDRIVEIMAAFDTRRAALRESRKSMTGRRFAEACIDFLKTGRHAIQADSTERKRNSAPLALVGGPLMERHLKLIEFIERSGGAIALDGTDTGERCFPAPFDMGIACEDPLEALTTAYFDSIPHPFRRPNDLFYEWLRKELESRAIKGLLMIRYPWCDIWHGETARLKEWSDVPVLDVDMGERGDGDDNRIKNRLMAFLEMLM